MFKKNTLVTVLGASKLIQNDPLELPRALR